MSKGISETFNEHEQDTARRAYEKEMVERTKRTAKISKAEIEEALRSSDSGTRPAVNEDEIRSHRERASEASDATNDAKRRNERERTSGEQATDQLSRDLRTRMEDGLSPLPIAAPVPRSLLPMDPEIDPHSRPTIDAFRPPPEIAALIEQKQQQQQQEQQSASDAARLTAPMPAYQPPDPASMVSPDEKRKPVARRAVLIPRWVITLAIVTVIMLIAAAGTLGFYLSHRLSRDLPNPHPPAGR